jgi:hypothetical protein
MLWSTLKWLRGAMSVSTNLSEVRLKRKDRRTVDGATNKITYSPSGNATVASPLLLRRCGKITICSRYVGCSDGKVHGSGSPLHEC